jgi:hypothetical protein
MTSPVQDAALQRLQAVRPQWRAVRFARNAVGLPEFTLLHAGPPYEDPCRPPPPVLSSAVLCCLYEGWAASEQDAEHLIATGRVKLVSAQSYGVVTPLAAVISGSTALVEAGDPTGAAWSLLGSGAGPQLRFGSRDPAILDRMKWRDSILAPALDTALRGEPVDLLALARHGLDNGDDLHARTTAASAALYDVLSARLTDSSIHAMLQQTPLFFLTLWMAACRLMTSAAAQNADPASTLVVSLAGNGIDVGIQLAGRPSLWHTAAAAAPAGPAINPALKVAAAPLTGDSGVIDIAGFGAQALALAPEPAGAFAAWLPPEWQREQAQLYAGSHPCFTDLHCGLDAARVALHRVAPLAAIAMIGADGRAGLLGRGLFAVPQSLFASAVQSLETRCS